MGRAVRLIVVLALAGCESEEPSGPVGVEAPCDGPALRFEPSGSYRVTIEERGQTYRSTLRFEPSDDGWSAVETELSVEPPSGSIGSLDGAELRWQLDESGVPLEPPRVRGEAHPGVLQNLTAFAFRPAGLTMDPVCQEIVLMRRWVDGMERTRRTSYQVASVNDERVTFSVTSTITTAVNEWRSEGRVRWTARMASPAPRSSRSPDRGHRGRATSDESSWSASNEPGAGRSRRDLRTVRRCVRGHVRWRQADRARGRHPNGDRARP